jgi:hypothetical protein
MNQDDKLNVLFEFNNISFRRSILILLLTVSLLRLGGCASTPALLSSESRMQLGRVGVLALPSTPRVEFHTFAKGWAAGAAKGGALGVVDGLLNFLGEAIRNQPTGLYAVPAILITAVMKTTVSTLAHGVAGGLEAVPGKTARQIEQELNAAIGNANSVSRGQTEATI